MESLSPIVSPSPVLIRSHAKTSMKLNASGGGRRAAIPTTESRMTTGAKSHSQPSQTMRAGFGNATASGAWRFSEPGNTEAQSSCSAIQAPMASRCPWEEPLPL